MMQPIRQRAARGVVAAISTLSLGACPLARGADKSAPWHSPSLTDNTVTAPNGAVTTPTALKANAL